LHTVRLPTDRTISATVRPEGASRVAPPPPTAPAGRYPYNILDVRRLGYRPVTRNVLAVAGMSFLVAGALAVADRRLNVLRGRITRTGKARFLRV
jgi:hypothetical protein